ncbi:MAG TPA: ABC transporter permease [Candidatus Margulisiibacteriota bacterium]|nr:ABC transporter permease [Candidatus Margulisiibacteriota bacterium]
MKFLVVCRRELRSYFTSYIAYILLAVFLLLSGYFFYSDLIFFVLFGGYVLPTGLWQFVFLDMRLCLLLVLPLMTMRLFAEERKLGTIELLWTYPVRDGEIVAGKFLACWLFFLLMLLLTGINPVVFYRFYQFDIGPLLAAYLGIFLLGTAFIACGLFVSSLTENQVVSAMTTYGILVFFWFMTWNEEAASARLLQALLRLSLFDRFYNFSRGVIDTRDVAFFVLFAGFFLFLTLLSLSVRKWRGVR